MADLSGDISGIIYRKTVSVLKGRISITGKMLEVLLSMDGHTDLIAIATKLSLRISDMRPIISKLLEHELIEEVPKTVAMLDPQFYGYLAGILSKIAGPIARVIVEDAVLKIGNGSIHVPNNRADELVALIGREIPDEKQRIEFVQTAKEKLKDL